MSLPYEQFRLLRLEFEETGVVSLKAPRDVR